MNAYLCDPRFGTLWGLQHAKGAALLGRPYPLHQDVVQRIIIRRIPSYSLLMTNGYHIIWTDTMFIVMWVDVEVAESNRMFSISTHVSSSLTVPTASDVG